MDATRGTAAILALAVGVALSACGKAPAPTPTGTPAPSNAAPAPSDGSAVDPTDPPTSPPEGDEFTFDQAARYDDGVTVEIGTIKGSQVTPTQSGAEGTAGHVVLAEIVVINKSAQPFVTDKMVVHGYYSGVGAPKIVDTSGAVGDSFKGTVAPGASAKATMGFAMPADQLDHVTIMVDGGDDSHGPLQFTGQIAKN
ncbi:hypothetical protein GCM10027418_30410 [Mariniluteicoccus endophyticus]